MNSVFKKVVTIAAAFSMLATSCISGYAAQITQDTDFTVQATKCGTSYTAKVGVKNGLSEKQSFNLITAVYSSDETPILTAVDLTSCAIEANTTSEFYTGGEVTVEDGESVRVFAWNDELYPLENGDEFRTLRRHATLSAIKVGSYPTVVDNQTKCIYVDTTDDISNATVSGEVASEGAKVEVSADKTTVTVTSEDELTVNTYKVVTSDKLTVIDFEDDSTTGWKFSGNKSQESVMEISTDPLSGSNKVLFLDDKVTTDKLSAQYDLSETIDAPFVVTYKAMYDRGTYSSTGENISGTWFHARNSSNNLISIGTTESGDVQRYNLKTNAGEQKANKVFELATWHELKMVCISNDEVHFYVDGVEMGLQDTSKTIGGPLTTNKGVNRLHYFSTDSRTMKAYFDDICVRPYYLGNAELESVAFTNGTDTYNTYIHDGTIYVKAASLAGLNMGNYSVENSGTAVYDATAATVTTTVPESGTSPAGQSTYNVVAKEYFEDDFESYTTGDATSQLENKEKWGGTQRYDVSLETPATEGGTLSATIESENNNQIVKLSDTDGNGTNGKRAMLNVINFGEFTNFIIECKVRNELVAGTSFVQDTNDVSYNIVEARNSNTTDGKQELAWMQPVWNKTNSEYRLNVAATANEAGEKDSEEGSVTLSNSMTLGTWYTYKMVFTAAEDATTGGTVNYYLNGDLVSTQAINNVAGLTKIFISTATKRTSIMSIDDIKIIPLD